MQSLNEIEKLKKLFAPLDSLTVEKTYTYIVKKGITADVPSSFLEDAKMYLQCGPFPDRNPTVWHVFQGRHVDQNSEEWENGILNYYRIITKPKIEDLDNNSRVITMQAKFQILVANAVELPQKAFKGITCAEVKTQLGTFPLTKNTE